MRLILVALLASGCAATPSFRDVPAQGAARPVVLIEHRMASEQEVRSTCAWRTREEGGKLFENAAKTGPLGCSWQEGGRSIVLCVKPESFNDHLAMEACGHEAFHQHNYLDHQ